MNLLIDIGNTNTKYTAVIAGQIGDVVVVANTNLTYEYCEQHFSLYKQIVVANVGTISEALLAQFCSEHQIILKLVNSEQHAFGITSGYTVPEQLGVDRWLAMIGAKSQFPNQHCLIVDSGTATTIDLLLASGEHQGGWIIPGVNMMIESFSQMTAKVTAQAQTSQLLAFGSNTSMNVNNGAISATLGAIGQALLLVERMNIQLDRLVITGGRAKQIASMLNQSCDLVEKLIFVGLARYCV